jgi:hypothetical protein
MLCVRCAALARDEQGCVAQEHRFGGIVVQAVDE